MDAVTGEPEVDFHIVAGHDHIIGIGLGFETEFGFIKARGFGEVERGKNGERIGRGVYGIGFSLLAPNALLAALAAPMPSSM